MPIWGTNDPKGTTMGEMGADLGDGCKTTSKIMRNGGKGMPFRPIFLLIFLLISSQIGHFLAANPQRPHHRRRQTERQNGGIANFGASSILFRYQCPQGCRCVPDIVSIELMIVSCQWTSLGPNSFENFPKNGTKSLAIQCTKMEGENEGKSALAKARAFQGFDELRELKITGCQTGHLAADLFLGVPHLRSLSLTKMPALRQIDPNFFVHLAKLEKLSLADNGLREMPGDGICPLRQLQVLNLSGNFLSSARLGIFMPRPSDRPCQFDQLIILDVSANSVQILAEQDLRPFPALRQLNLASNGMVEIQPDAFRSGPVPLLQHLDISSNRLSDLPSGLPEGLLHLDSASNRFQQIPDSIAQLAGLARLNLSGNQIGQSKMFLQSSAIEQLDLSWNRFERVPVEIFAECADSLKTLKLAGNQIEGIGTGSLVNLSSLQEFDISSNRLSSLQFGTFEGLSNLAILNLANNSIGQLDVEVFQPLASNLHTLIMAQNSLTELPMAVGRLSRVRRMDISGNKISKAYKFVLNKLPHLARLDLGQNALESVESFVFMECDHLQELSLRANRIATISPDAFEKCAKLKRIDLGQNQLSNIGPSLTLLKGLRAVNLTGNLLEELNWAEFPPELLEISANGNRIGRIGTLGGMEEDGEEGRKLRKLELKGNRIARLLPESLPLGLEELDLSENGLANLANNTFHGMGQLKSVNLRSNRLGIIPRELFELVIEGNAPFGRMWIAENSLECNCEMGWLLNASRVDPPTTTTTGGVQDIREVECMTPLGGKRKAVIETETTDFLCPYTQFCEAGCVCCFFRDCDCKSKCPKGCECFRDSNSITNVVKCDGRMGENEDSDQLELLPMMASHILLSGLNLPLLKENAFAGRIRLVELQINSSRVKRIQPKAFNTLINLKSLDLANNQLEQINGDEGFSIQNIRRLNLANNRITNKNINLVEMVPRLEELYLEGNLLEELPPYLRNYSVDQLQKITVAGNRFRCDCSSNGRFDVPHWLARNRVRVLDSERLKCMENVTKAQKTNDTTVLSLRLPNEGEDLFTMSMLEFLSDENRTICVAQTTGIFGFGGSLDVLMFLFLMTALLLIIPILVIFAIRPQWFANSAEKRQNQEEKNGLLLPTNNNSLSSTHSPTINGGSPIPTELSQHVLPNECDIFICYTKNDEKAIMEFCRPLEVSGYILCFLHQCGYYREDPVYISNELIKLIGESRMLVVYLSREFIQRDWNRPQLTSSIKLDKKQNESRRILFIVGYDMDETDLANLPIEIGGIILRDGYLRRDSPQFWEDLRRVLRDLPPIRYPSPVSETSQSHIYSEYDHIPPAPSDFV